MRISDWSADVCSSDLAADVGELHVAPQRRVLTLPFIDEARAADGGAGEGAHRSSRDGVDADAVAAEVGCQIAHAGLERRLGDAHDVVVRDRKSTRLNSSH